MSIIHLALSGPQYLVLKEILNNIKLGDRTLFEEEISNLLVDLDNDVGEFNEAQLHNEFGRPDISVRSTEDGFWLEVE